MASDTHLKHVAVMLERASRQKKAKVWSDASRLLTSPGSTRVEVNLGRLTRAAGEGTRVLVPGKVLGFGNLGKKLTVGAYSFSASARAKIAESGGSALTLEEFVKKYPDGGGVRIVR
jgi:large subunit ribosomal protein L18e